MAQPLATDSISLTGAGVGLVTDASGAIHPGAVEALLVDDVRALSRWEIELVGSTIRRVGWERTGLSSDRLLFAVSEPHQIDPVAVLERRREVVERGLREMIELTAFASSWRGTLQLHIDRDDLHVYSIGETVDAPSTTVCVVDGGLVVPSPEPGGPAMSLSAPGWQLAGVDLTVEVDLARGETWSGSVELHVAPLDGSSADRRPPAAVSTTTIETQPAQLGRAIAHGRGDLRALTRYVDDRPVIVAGSPFFLALFGRDSMIAGLQSLVDSVDPLVDILHVLASRQATTSDEVARSQPGQILHELRLGRAGVFGVPPRSPYYGAVDNSPLFVTCVGEAMRWGAARDDIAALLPAVERALAWCRDHGDVDGDGFIESVPHATGLTNLGWKDSADSILDARGRTIVGSVALSEVQAYWYRALRTHAEIERWLGVGDGAASLASAGELARRFLQQFLYGTDEGPFVGLALDADKKLLALRTSNAGHVLWSGILPDDVGRSVATQLAGDDLFSGWGVRTVGARVPGYNPFGYHRGSVWPHDTALALHGASRYGHVATVRTLSDGLIALEAANGGQLPELISGIARSDIDLPVPYAAACRPQAWAAGAPLVVLRALLGLEPDVPSGILRLNPCLPEGATVAVKRLRLGDHEVSFTVEGPRVVDIDAPGLTVETGDTAVLARTGW